MKGFLIIILIYSLTLITCVLIKYLSQKFEKNKRKGATASPKIYYVTSKKKPKKRANSTLPIKASVVEKEPFEN